MFLRGFFVLHPALSKVEGSFPGLFFKVLSFGEDLGEATCIFTSPIYYENDQQNPQQTIPVTSLRFCADKRYGASA